MQNLKNMQKVTKMFADMNHKEKVQFFQQDKKLILKEISRILK